VRMPRLNGFLYGHLNYRAMTSAGRTGPIGTWTND